MVSKPGSEPGLRSVVQEKRVARLDTLWKLSFRAFLLRSIDKLSIQSGVA